MTISYFGSGRSEICRVRSHPTKFDNVYRMQVPDVPEVPSLPSSPVPVGELLLSYVVTIGMLAGMFSTRTPQGY